jgi:FMN phosphatase YigB (HAD superfamily)
VTIRAVTFDYWQTLVSERRGDMRAMLVDRWVAILAGADQPRSGDLISEGFTANWSVFEQYWGTNAGQWGPVQAAQFVADRLELNLGDGLGEALVDSFRIVGENAPLYPAPGIEKCLGSLKDAGLRVGIVCDVGMTSSPTLRGRLAGFGLLDFFDAWSFRDETGWFKPAEEAFRPALDGLGVAPADAAHVGDNERTDIAGAKALGMKAIQYAGFYEMAAWLPEQAPGRLADHVIHDFASLPPLLGIE